MTKIAWKRYGFYLLLTYSLFYFAGVFIMADWAWLSEMFTDWSEGDRGVFLFSMVIPALLATLLPNAFEPS